MTLTGPGGIGKTSFAIEAARGLVADFDGGGWLVELAPLANPDLVPSTVASLLGLKFSGEIGYLDPVLIERRQRRVEHKAKLAVLGSLFTTRQYHTGAAMLRQAGATMDAVAIDRDPNLAIRMVSIDGPSADQEREIWST
jgi:hypothetical protein